MNSVKQNSTRKSWRSSASPARFATCYQPFWLTSLLAGSIWMVVATVTAADNNTNATASSLADLSVEQLMNESVTSVAKRDTKFDESPAAIYVITQDDIRRQGITTLPEALRLAPGLNVAQINSHEWSISARGFDGEFANKLLVLIDGRSVYGSGFGGVVWSLQNIVMEDIDRIEVIRGPGASLWGANAVNGVINIITKSAKDTQGALVSVEGGTVEQPVTTIRYGGQLATNLFYRAYGKVSNFGVLSTSTGQDSPDQFLDVRGGFRLDWLPSDDNDLTLQGDLYRQRAVEAQDVALLTPPYLKYLDEVDYNSGGNVLGRWTHNFSDTSSLTLQAYYDRFQDEQADAGEVNNTYDFDAQHRFSLGSRNDITWGLGFREIQADYRSSLFAMFSPESTRDNLFSSFVQDEITLLPNRVKLTLGSKFEHNDYTGFEFEPSVRLAWTPTERQTIWAAVSRAVRTPAWSDLHSTANVLVEPPSFPLSPLPVLFSTMGNPNLKSENVIAYELGYRVEVTPHVSLDIAGFYNDYRDLIAPTDINTSVQAGSLPPYVQVTSTDENAGSAHTYGVETSVRWDVTGHWHLTANYSWYQYQVGFNSSSTGIGPEHQAQLRSTLDLPCHLELNGDVSFVDQLMAPYGIGEMHIPNYTRLDLGLVWHATKNLEFGIWGQNLLQDQHVEFTSYKTLVVTEIPRGFVCRATWRF